jgi:putative flippase GtrA
VEGFAANLVITVVVIILNYILSKFLVFKKKKSE